MKPSIPSQGDRYDFPQPQQPQPTTVALTGFVIILAWLAMIGFGTVIMWGLQ